MQKITRRDNLQNRKRSLLTKFLRRARMVGLDTYRVLREGCTHEALHLLQAGVGFRPKSADPLCRIRGAMLHEAIEPLIGTASSKPRTAGSTHHHRTTQEVSNAIRSGVQFNVFLMSSCETPHLNPAPPQQNRRSAAYTPPQRSIPTDDSLVRRASAFKHRMRRQYPLLRLRKPRESGLFWLHGT